MSVMIMSRIILMNKHLGGFNHIFDFTCVLVY